MISEPAPSEVNEFQSPAAAYQINWQVVSIGGDVATSAGYSSHHILGQDVIGMTDNTTTSAGQGFWYGATTGGSTPTCACDCHGDPACDAVIANIQDVVLTINVAFRGAAAMSDPNPLCPNDRTDVGGGPNGTCDGATNVIDVVKMVNVAFRGANPATEFCLACPASAPL
ncbi:MAG TPA: hypothetical protein VNN55_01730 [bacterium]|nr:hypothetical protein [bacterium]